MKLGELRAPADLPCPEARIPGAAIRVTLVLVGTLLTLVAYRSVGWLVIGIPLSVLAARSPDYLLAWVLIVFLALGELGRHATLSWQLLVLVAGLHLIHVLASLTLVLPARTWVRPATFRRALRRFIAIQIPAQAVAVVAMLTLAPNAHGHRPVTVREFGVVGAVAIAGLTMLLLRRALSDPQTG
jgi:hypothetical protein